MKKITKKPAFDRGHTNRNPIHSHFSKRIVAVFSVILLAFSINIYGADIFAQLTKMKEVESTYVSGKFSHNMRKWYSRTGEHSMNLSQGFSALYTYQCWSKESVAAAQKILNDYLSKNKSVELMMQKKDAVSEYKVYEKFNTEGKITQMIIWDAEGPNLCEIVVVDWKEGLDRNASSYTPKLMGGNRLQTFAQSAHSQPNHNPESQSSLIIVNK